ncbi:hypothetical protein NM688_g5567 [Phlebia brevispora]|uniref:Uncharacterized protein n=1 Tax=Phlebia brevispora TaxID=194682 RepID=A0ACC1ST10_9APHY|nr:hypothetical protein NM688_g5567 [Phlebia brevispora]
MNIPPSCQTCTDVIPLHSARPRRTDIPFRLNMEAEEGVTAPVPSTPLIVPHFDDLDSGPSAPSAALQYPSQSMAENRWTVLDACELFNGPSEQRLAGSQWELTPYERRNWNYYEDAQYRPWVEPPSLMSLRDGCYEARHEPLVADLLPGLETETLEGITTAIPSLPPLAEQDFNHRDLDSSTLIADPQYFLWPIAQSDQEVFCPFRSFGGPSNQILTVAPYMLEAQWQQSVPPASPMPLQDHFRIARPELTDLLFGRNTEVEEGISAATPSTPPTEQDTSDSDLDPSTTLTTEQDSSDSDSNDADLNDSDCTNLDFTDYYLDTSALSAASQYFLDPTPESDPQAFSTCTLFNEPSEQNLTGSQWHIIPQQGQYWGGYYKEAQWIRYDIDINLLNIDIAHLTIHLDQRVPAPPIPEDVLMQPRFKRPATIADIPPELHDLITHYFIHEPCAWVGNYGMLMNPGHECQGWYECRRNYVACSQSELGRIALVCRRWADAIRPAMFLRIRLNSKRVKSWATFSESRQKLIGQYIQRIEAKFDGAENLREPWIHHIGLFVVPKLSGLKTSSVELTLEGPLPKKYQMLSSIHPPFRQFRPGFSAGIGQLCLFNVHFKSFTHLVRLVKEMPSIYRVECRRVTWDTRAGEIMHPTSYLARDDPSARVDYEMHRCTNDAGTAWLGIFVALTRDGGLDRSDADALRVIAEAAKCRQSDRWEDKIGLRFYGLDVIAHLTPRAGVRERRRIRAIVVELRYVEDVSLWPKIVETLATLNALEVVLFALGDAEGSKHYLEHTHPSVLRHRLPGLKFALPHDSDEDLFVRAVLEDGGFHKHGEPIEVDLDHGVETWEAFI